MDAQNVKIWVRLESLLFGIIPEQVATSDQLKIKYLRRIIPYIQKKATNPDFSNVISYRQWIHIACDKLDFPVPVAKYYFGSFIILCRSLQIGKSATIAFQPKYEILPTDFEDQVVDVYEFVIFLYIQHFSNFKSKFLSNTLSSPTQEWPSVESTDQCLQSEICSLKNVFDEDRYREFVLEGMQEIFELFAGKDFTHSRDDVIKLEWLQAFNLILGVSLDGNIKVKTLESLCRSEDLRTHTGFIAYQSAFLKRNLLNFLKSRLSCGPFSLQSVLRNGKVLSWLKNDQTLRSGTGHTITNSPYATPNSKLVLFAFIVKCTLARMSTSLHYSNVYLHRCFSSYLYLLDPLRNLTVEKCKDVTLVTGPVSGTVYLSGCKNLKVMVICSRLVISDCRDCMISVATQINPLLVGSKNMNIVLGPFCTYYPTLEEHLRDTNMQVQGGMFENPLVMDDKGEMSGANVYSVLPPEKFSYFAVPYKMSGKTNKIPFLPSSYYKSVKRQRNSLKEWQDEVKSKLNTQQMKEIQKIVRLRMKLWMRETTFQRELDQLSGKCKVDNSVPKVITGNVIDIPS